jgi:NTE family protein
MARTAIVLSGGGSKGDFEVGALHYLYSVGIRPDILCTTSVGSVNGIKLAEGETGPNKGLAGLTAMWLSMTDHTDFFVPAGWLDDSTRLLHAFRQYLQDFAAMNATGAEDELTLNDSLLGLRLAEIEAVAARLDEIGVNQELAGAGALGILALGSAVLLPPPVNTLATVGFGSEMASILATNLQGLQSALSATSFFTVRPLEVRARASVDLTAIADWAKSGGRLRMASVALESGVLRYISETGALLERDGTPVTAPAALPAPECQALADQLEQLEAQVRDAQARVAGGDHSSGASTGLRRVIGQRNGARTALDACQAAHPQPPMPVTVNLVEGMLASSAIPTFFAPQLMNSEHYVDGGIRAVLPVEAAMLDGAERIVAVHASKRGVDPISGADLDLLSISLRSVMDIAINEIASRDAAAADGRPGMTLIEPRVDIHTVFTLYPAFVRNQMAYGWMCAADAVAPPPNPMSAARAADIADQISRLRYGAARLECWLGGHPIPPTMVTVERPGPGARGSVADTLTAMKAEIRTLIAERIGLGAAMPSGRGEWDDPNQWWFGHETHPWSTLRGDDAFFESQDIPLELPVGGTASVSVVFRNVGTTTWDPATGYRLGSQEPQDNLNWGLGRVGLAGPTHPGDVATFTFTIKAPAPPGGQTFCWRMLQEGVRWFGETSLPVRIVVTSAGEPAACAGLRSRVAAIDMQIEDLESQLLDEPQHDAPINRRISALQLEHDNQMASMRATGCTL